MPAYLAAVCSVIERVTQMAHMSDSHVSLACLTHMSDTVQEDPARQLLHAEGTLQDIPRMLPAADIVIVAASQDAGSRGLINAAFLSHCKCVPIHRSAHEPQERM